MKASNKTVDRKIEAVMSIIKKQLISFFRHFIFIFRTLQGRISRVWIRIIEQQKQHSMKAVSVRYSSEYRIKRGYEWMSYILQFHNGEITSHTWSEYLRTYTQPRNRESKFNWKKKKVNNRTIEKILGNTTRGWFSKSSII